MKPTQEERAEALSAETTATRLQQLAWSYPVEVLQNPAVPLLALESPAFLRQILDAAWRGIAHRSLRSLSADSLRLIAEELEALLPAAIANASRETQNDEALSCVASYAKGECSLSKVLCATLIAKKRIYTRQRSIELNYYQEEWMLDCSLYKYSIGTITCKPAQVARVIRAWLFDEVIIEDMVQHFACEPTEEALLAESGGAQAIVTHEWEQRKNGKFFSEHKPLLFEAERHPKLRQLSLFSSHYELHFSRTILHTKSDLMPYAIPKIRTEPQQYIVRLGNSQLGEGDAKAAVALLLAHLPADIGPAILGNEEDL